MSVSTPWYRHWYIYFIIDCLVVDLIFAIFPSPLILLVAVFGVIALSLLLAVIIEIENRKQNRIRQL